MEKYGRLDVLVNNAGIAPRVRRDILEMDEDSFDEVLGVNLRGTTFMCQLAAKAMLEGKKTLSDYAPRIINIGSMSAYTASVNRGEYCISKAGVGMVTKLFAARLASEGIPVFEVRPGIIDTDMTKGVHEKYRKLLTRGFCRFSGLASRRMSQEWFWRAAPDCWIIRRGRRLTRTAAFR